MGEWKGVSWTPPGFKPLSGIYLWPAAQVTVIDDCHVQVSNPSREFTSGQQGLGIVVVLGLSLGFKPLSGIYLWPAT